MYPQTYRNSVERAISTYEEEKSKLLRPDGRPLYSNEERTEREAELLEDLREKVNRNIEQAREDAGKERQKAAAYSYQDPTALLTSIERDRLSVSAPLIKEDVEMMELSELAQRLEAVSASSDKVAKLLHARYAGFRAQRMKREIEEAGRRGAQPPHSVEDSRALREVATLSERLEASLEDPEREEARKKASEEARALEEVANFARRRLSEVDGTDEAAREAMRRQIFESI